MFSSDIEPSMDEATQDDGLTPAQNTLIRWQYLIAFGPFILVVLLAQTRAANRLPNWMILPGIIIPVIWAVAFKGYILYLNYQKN
jgi:hypothetical protein